MKSSIKAFALIAVLAFVAVGCNKIENILPKKDGLWQSTSQKVDIYWNGALVTSVTETDSLGTTYFEKEGTGWTKDYAGRVTSNFTWSVNDDNDAVTIVDDSTNVSTVFDVLENEKDAMTWFNTVTVSDSLLGTIKTDITGMMERVK